MDRQSFPTILTGTWYLHLTMTPQEEQTYPANGVAPCETTIQLATDRGWPRYRGKDVTDHEWPKSFLGELYLLSPIIFYRRSRG